MQKLKGSAALLAAYVAVVLLATLLPFAPDTSPAFLAGRIARALNPAVSGRDAVDALRNIVLFAGWGVIWVLTRPARPASPSGGTRPIRGAVATALLLSAAVEILQLFSAERTASILDVATNTGGALAGAAVVVALESLVRRRRGSPSYIGIPAFLLAGGYGAAVALEGFAPLLRQQQRIPGLWGSATERLGVALELASAGVGSVGVLDVVLFAPAGLFAVVALAELGVRRSRAAILTAVLAVPIMLMAELLHGALGYDIHWAPAIVHALAVTLGGAVAAYGLPAGSRALRGRIRPLATYMFFAVLLPLWAWRPFSPAALSMLTDKLALVQFVPLAAYRDRMDVFTAVDVMIPVLILAPIGALLAVWPLRRAGLLAGLWPGLWTALVLEAGQILVAGRYFDITDVLIQAGALVIGWSVARRTGFVPYGEALPKAATSGSPNRT